MDQLMLQCQRCNHAGRYSTWVTSRWHLEPRIQRCERCGSAHACERGATPSPIGPALQSIAAGGRLSPWIDARYRPYVVGAFECEWRDGLRVRLWWNGSAWTWTGQRVAVGDMMKWRGTWGNQ